MSNSKKRITEIAVCSLFTAIICILAQIVIFTPFGVPFTLQIFAVSLGGYILGAKKSIYSVLVYILLGVVGIPVFSGFKGGIQHLFGTTGGFIFGFLAVAVFCGIAARLKNGGLKITFSVFGVVICHIFGTLQLALVSESNILSAFVTASLPFILKDLLLTIGAFFTARLVNKRLKIR